MEIVHLNYHICKMVQKYPPNQLNFLNTIPMSFFAIYEGFLSL